MRPPPPLGGRLPCDVHPSLALPVARAVFARLGLAFSPPPQPELQTHTDEQGHEGTRTTDGVWADGSLAVRLRSVSEWWGSTTTTSGGAGSYVMELSGLPGDARVTLNGASTLSLYRVEGPADPAALVEAALLAEVADRLAREATWLPHPSVPAEWIERAAAVALAARRQSLAALVPDVVLGVGDGAPFALLSAGALGVPDAWRPEPSLRILGPLPAARDLEPMEWSCPLLPVPSSLLRLFGSPPATIPTRVRRTLRGVEASGLFGPPVPGGEVEEVTVWRAGSWTLREARVYERARLARADVALQCEPGGAWALFLQFTAPLEWMPDQPGRLCGIALGTGSLLPGLAGHLKTLLAQPLPTGPPLPEFVQLPAPPADRMLGADEADEAARRMLPELADGTRWIELEFQPHLRREYLHHDPAEGWRVLSFLAAHDLDFALSRPGRPSARTLEDARAAVASLLARRPGSRTAPVDVPPETA